MAKSVRVPQLGLMMEGGTLLRWRKAEGDAVRPGEVLFELETDKATVEVEAEAAGYLRGVALAEGDYAAVGTHLAWIAATPDEPLEAAPDEQGKTGGGQGWPAPEGTAVAQAGGSAGAPPTAAPASPGPAAPVGAPAAAPWAPTPSEPAQPLQSAPARSASASPYARRLAREAGVDWASLAGSGPGGRVVARDVNAAAAGGPPAATPVPPALGGVPASAAVPPRDAPMRAAIARRTALIAQVPLFWATRTVEMVRVREALARTAGRWPVRPTYTDFFLQACILGLSRAPRIHGRFRDGRAEPHTVPAIGLAVLVPGGLLVPVLRPRPDATLRELAEMRAGLVARARSGRLAAADMGDPTFTLSNLGSLGVEGFQALPDPAAAAALAVGAVVDRPAVREGVVVALPLCQATLTLDHRVADGADAAAFLGALAAYCEGGEGLRLD